VVSRQKKDTNIKRLLVNCLFAFIDYHIFNLNAKYA
jgi:hypothetical protein